MRRQSNESVAQRIILALMTNHYERALELDRKGVAAEPLNPHRRLDLSFSEASMAWLLLEQGQFDAALASYRTSLRLRQEVFAADPDNEFAFRSLVRAHHSVADVFARKGDFPPAEAEARALAMASR